MAAFPQLEQTCAAMGVVMADNIPAEIRRLRLRNASQALEIERLRMQVADLQQAQMSHWFTGERQLTWREFALQRQGRVSQLLFGIIPRAVEMLQTARDIVSLGHITPQVRTALRAMTTAVAVLEENEVMDEDYEEVDEDDWDINIARAPDGPRGSNNLY